ncbi:MULTISPECIES: endonuclease V [unclassified Hydrogenobaculum]|uniref:endonuclease V n=1 Tax=unclassified Hydrogenobaculum TaxID=2622382 RepID=UPI0001C51C41|nr:MULTISPECIES: endonuclease V [unclassified Hydrogenobaculum]AEF19843.1 Deoxyribonuclease V [Hydrogenobaculum sp. 3684]AEG47129.1 Endonuclease V [Hydrogenobaculum sp. SHO]AGG15777.1 Endonuclease V [Hydrogenobaculum sp. HO]AGH94077.1 deoxyinosine 3'endonuclease (endonuclease V) [Hydrogenobaculum sp. SN]
MLLAHLKTEQIECSKKIIKKDGFNDFNTIGGIDLTFIKNKDKTIGIGALVILDKDKNKIYEHTYKDYVDFPYIPGFLSYREFPIMEKLVNTSKVLPDIYMIDGNGMLHPRFCGLASHFGVNLDKISFGVAKKLLIGDIDKENNIILNNIIVGKALKTKKNVKPIYVSIGHKISLESAVNITLHFSKYRIPEPTRLAHNLLKEIRKEVEA